MKELAVEAKREFKKPEHWIYLAAYMATQRMFVVCCTDLDEFEKGDNPNHSEIYLTSKLPDPEKVAIKNDCFAHLSEEAKFVIDLLIREDFEEVVYSKKRKQAPTKTKLRRVLQNRFSWSRLKLNRTFKELMEYVKDL